MKKPFVIYALVIAVVGLGLYLVLEYGRHLPAPSGDATPTLVPAHGPTVSSADLQGAKAYSSWDALRGHLQDPLALLLLQLVVIVLATRSLGALFTNFRQPAVIGEMAAGILLGPSLLGWVWPAAHQFVFPTGSLATLKLLSQIGVCLYLFVVGMELDIDRMRHRAYTAVVVSHASIMLPYFLGVVASLALYSAYAGPRVSFTSFALFMGIAMSITAFPVLARIIEERGLAKTELGSMAITCAAVDDATAWSILAAIVAVVHAGGLVAALLSLGLAVVFVALMFGLVRRQLPHLLQIDQLHGGVPTKTTAAIVLLLILASALTTEAIGIHALFGAFLAGVIMPERRDLRHAISIRIEQFSSVFLLPLFFAFTGLRTQIGLLADPMAWLVCLALIFIATVGKLGGSMVTAKLTGMTWRDSFALGALMNTRGLMELIALNLGYDFGILSPRIFAMMVLMALATTVMTGPLLGLVEHSGRREVCGPARVA
jgi:Kef-type K+ transport system membrane component KefB